MDELLKKIVQESNYPFKSYGSSMFPILKPGYFIFFKNISINNIYTNDIILVKKGTKLFCHRIVYKGNCYFITKGDNNLKSDKKIYPQQIVAKVHQIKRNGKIFNPEELYLLQSTLYFQEICKIKFLMQKEKIDFVFLKGLPLHLYYEKTHPRRIYLDCDVLIKKEDFQKAEKIIEKFGYVKAEKKKKQIENNYSKTINGFPVIFDLHLEPAFLMTQFSGLEALYPQKLINNLTNELIETKKQIKINNESFFILNTKYLILYLALHIFHHNFHGAFRYQFLDKVIRKSRLLNQNWQKIASMINNYQLTNFTYPVFVLLEKYYQTPIPSSFFKTIRPPNFMNVMDFKNFKNLNIFDDEPRIKAGINRFKNIFYLSLNPWWRKIFVFTNFEVVYTIFWIVLKKLSSFFSNRRLNP